MSAPINDGGQAFPLTDVDRSTGFVRSQPGMSLRDYFADGWRTLAELMLLLEAVDRPLLRTPRVLEFASGHGRFTRHLVKALGAPRVTVSDVVPSAVEFSRATFGVEACLQLASLLPGLRLALAGQLFAQPGDAFPELRGDCQGDAQ